MDCMSQMQTLCLFHVLQANWQWLWDSSNNSLKAHQPALMTEFQRVMLATDVTEAEQQFIYSTTTSLANKYPHWKNRVKLYCHAKNNGVWQCSHHTNNYSEVTMQLFKDIVLAHAKAYKAIALVDFVCTAMEQYY